MEDAPDMTDASAEVGGTEFEADIDSPTGSTEVDAEEGGAGEGEATYTVKVDGEELEVSLSELLNGYQRQADYTRKTQELASEREQIAAMRALKEALDSDPQGAIDVLMDLYGLTRGEAEDALEDLDPLEREVRELRSWREQQEQQAQQQRIISEAEAAIQAAGLEVSADALLDFAVQKRIGDLSVAAELMSVQERKEAVSEDRERKVEAKRQASVVEGGKARSAAAVEDKPASSIREAFARAKALHG